MSAGMPTTSLPLRLRRASNFASAFLLAFLVPALAHAGPQDGAKDVAPWPATLSAASTNKGPVTFEVAASTNDLSSFSGSFKSLTGVPKLVVGVVQVAQASFFLAPDTTYYWRHRGMNTCTVKSPPTCKPPPYSPIFSFTT